MRFEKLGEISIESLTLEAAPDIEVSPSFMMFRDRDDPGTILQVFRNGRVCMDIIDRDVTITYQGTCTTEELEQFENMEDYYDF